MLNHEHEKLNAFAKLVGEAGPWRLEVSASAYDSSWTATDQLPLRAVESGLIDRFCFIDPDLGGESTRPGVTGNATYSHTDASQTRLNAYGVDYDFALFSNFTYLLDDPVNADEFEQLDDRTYLGAGPVQDRCPPACLHGAPRQCRGNQPQPLG